jgi:hypothetical protein
MDADGACGADSNANADAYIDRPCSTDSNANTDTHIDADGAGCTNVYVYGVPYCHLHVCSADEHTDGDGDERGRGVAVLGTRTGRRSRLAPSGRSGGVVVRF